MRCYELYKGIVHRFEDKAVISTKITVKETCFDGLSFLCFGLLVTLRCLLFKFCLLLAQYYLSLLLEHDFGYAANCQVRQYNGLFYCIIDLVIWHFYTQVSEQNDLIKIRIFF